MSHRTPLDTERLQRADAELDALADAGADARHSRLGELRMRDPQLAALVAELLAAFDRSDEVGEITGAAAAPLVVADEPLPAGSRIGGFMIDALLGRGGMGEVYRAHRGEAQFAQTVAVKRILASSLLDPARAAAHLARERRLLARLSHPGLATVIDGGVDDAGFPWLAMEYIDGARLDHYLRECRPDFAQRFSLLLQLIDTVAYAHRQLVVHGDLKPANLLVEDGARLRVLDFGIARSLAEEAAPSAAGTPGWSSPEQARGEPAGIASDQFQIGLLARFLLANAGAGTREPNATLTALATGHGLEHARRLDADLDAILRRCLAAAPGQRYSDLGSLRADLCAWREHRPLSLRRGELLYPLRCLLRRHPLSATLAASLLAIAATAAVALWRQNAELDAALDQARLAQANSERALARQSRLFEWLNNVFSIADPRGASGRVQTIDDMLDIAQTEAPRHLADSPVLQVEAQIALATIALRRNQPALAERALAAIAAHEDRLDDPMTRGKIAILRGDAAAFAQRGEQAVAHYREALPLFADATREHRIRRLYLHGNLVYQLAILARTSEAAAHVEAAMTLVGDPELPAFDRGETLGALALAEADPARALAMHQRAYDLLATVIDPGQPAMIRRLTNIAAARMIGGDYAGATRDYARGLQQATDNGWLDSDFHAIPQSAYGKLLALQGRWEEAGHWLQRAVRLVAAAANASTPLYLEGNRLEWALETADPLALRPSFEDWASRTTATLGGDSPRGRQSERLRARLWRRLGDFDRAARWLDARIAKTADAPDDEHERLRIERFGLALDQLPRDAACAFNPFRDHAPAPRLLDPALVSARVLALDLALCSDGDVAAARKALAEQAGIGYWLLQRRRESG